MLFVSTHHVSFQRYSWWSYIIVFFACPWCLQISELFYSHYLILIQIEAHSIPTLFQCIDVPWIRNVVHTNGHGLRSQYFFSHKCPNQRGKHIMSGGMFQWWFNDEIVEHHEAVCIGSCHVNGGYSLGITWWRVGIKFMHFPSWIDSLSAMNIWCHYIKLVSVSIRLWLSLLHTCKGG